MRRTSSNEPLRVLFLSKGLGPGGMERLLVHHVSGGDRERFEYSVAYLVERPESVVGELEDAGAECTRLGTGSRTGSGWIRELVGLVRDRGIHVVHAHSPQPAALSRPLLRAMPGGPKLVYTEHNTWDCYGAPTRLANAATYVLDHAQFAVSNDARQSVPKLLRGRVEVLTHGVDLEALRSSAGERAETRRRLGIGAEEVVITNLAHLRAEKDQDVLLEASSQLFREHAGCRVLVVGHGPRRPELVALRDRLGLGDRFTFLGFRPDAAEILAASDVFCLSSSQEGLPVAFMEAAALGLPTVATRVGGLPDHIQQDVSGILVPPRDPRALAAALGTLVADASLRERMGAAALAGSEVFDAGGAIRRQEDTYDFLCGRSAALDDRRSPSCAG